MPRPRISVLIPTYNRATFLTQSINSVLRQTFRDLEILVIDDGSTDGTRKVLEPYMDRITYLSQPHTGVANARNLGLEYARGDFIAFLDSDDEWFPRKLELQVERLAETPEAGLSCTDFVIARQGVNEEWIDAEPKRFIARNKGSSGSSKTFPALSDLFRKNFIGTLTVLVPRIRFEDVGHFDTSFVKGSDYDMWIRIAERYPLTCVPITLARHRRHADSLTGLDPERIVRTYLDVTGTAIQRDPIILDRVGLTYDNYRDAAEVRLAGGR